MSRTRLKALIRTLGTIKESGTCTCLPLIHVNCAGKLVQLWFLVSADLKSLDLELPVCLDVSYTWFNQIIRCPLSVLQQTSAFHDPITILGAPVRRQPSKSGSLLSYTEHPHSTAGMVSKPPCSTLKEASIILGRQDSTRSSSRSAVRSGTGELHQVSSRCITSHHTDVHQCWAERQSSQALQHHSNNLCTTCNFWPEESCLP